MTQLVTAGRTDINDFFRLSGCLDQKELHHNPILAFFEPLTDHIIVKIVRYPTDVAIFPPSTKLMAQWPGRWNSDFFRFTAGQVQEYLKDSDPAKFARWKDEADRSNRIVQYNGMWNM